MSYQVANDVRKVFKLDGYMRDIAQTPLRQKMYHALEKIYEVIVAFTNKWSWDGRSGPIIKTEIVPMNCQIIVYSNGLFLCTEDKADLR